MKENYSKLLANIKLWSKELGFQQIGITKPNPNRQIIAHLNNWLDHKLYGDMDFMLNHRNQRIYPEQLLPEVKSIICCSMNYLGDIPNPKNHIAAYAQGHDYHKIMRKRLKQLAQKTAGGLGEESQQNFRFRVFCDSAPIFEKGFATQAGLGWTGNNTLLINSKLGSYFFLGEIYTNLELPTDQPFSQNLCGRCNKCLKSCPTKALIAAKTLDANRCIAYLTIEHKGHIPEELRTLIGTKIYGCDICQQCCPWNRFAKISDEQLLATHSYLNKIPLSELFLWDEQTYLANTAGSPLLRLGHQRWLRNIAIALGNSSPTKENLNALQQRINHPSPIVREHAQWALQQIAT